MARVGQPQEEEDEEGMEERAQPNQPDENALDHERGLRQETAVTKPPPEVKLTNRKLVM